MTNNFKYKKSSEIIHTNVAHFPIANQMLREFSLYTQKGR